ncbi:MAG: ornithine carbamoyltransferase [Desulfovibrionaceae bacterium]|nr:ornithine carbamoyltransferase [Desulfovibrionaceae bacterium]
MPRHFIQIGDLGKDGAMELIRRAKTMKESGFRGHCMDGKVAALIFEKASTRTRVSFDVAVRQLGGTTIFMTPAESQLGRSEPLRDAARVLSRYLDCMIVRTFGQEKLDELMEYGSIPVVNALTDQGHPCQVMADLLTIYERTPDFSQVRVAWIGDGNNMANSWIEASMYFPFELSLAVAPGYEPDMDLMARAKAAGAKITTSPDPREAAKGAHYLYADVWASMGQEQEQAEREKVFKNFCINRELMSLAAPDAKFMHCLPAHRGEEVTDEIMEGEASIIWDEAENRLHAQKAILEWVFSDAE